MQTEISLKIDPAEVRHFRAKTGLQDPAQAVAAFISEYMKARKSPQWKAARERVRADYQPSAAVVKLIAAQGSKLDAERNASQPARTRRR